MNALKCRTLTATQHSNLLCYVAVRVLHFSATTIIIIRSSWHHLFTFRKIFFGPGFNSTIPLTINNNAMNKAVTSRLHITFESLHVHFSQFTLSLCSSHKFSSITHLQPTIRGQKQPMEDLHCSTEIMVKREIKNSQTRSTS